MTDLILIPKPISDPPEKDGWYYVMNPNKEILPRMIEFKVGEFHNHNKVLAAFWLQPLDRKEYERKIAGEAWDAAENRRDEERAYPYGKRYNKWNHPNKIDYLNSL